MADALAGGTGAGTAQKYDSNYTSIFGNDLTLPIKTGETPKSQDTYTVIAVHAGSVDVEDQRGDRQTLTDYNGQPITIGSDNPKRPGRGTAVKLAPWVRTQAQGDGSLAIIVPHGGDVQDDTLQNIVNKYILEAQSSDPNARKDFIDLQDKLIAGGILSPKEYKRGLPDDATLKALDYLLSVAHRTLQTPDETLQQLADDAQSNPTKKVVRDYHLTSPEDIADAAKKAAPNLIGRAPTKAELAKMAAAYNAIEYANQDTAFNTRDQELAMQTTGDPGAGVPDTLTYNVPDAENFIADQLRQANPIAANGMAVGQNLAAFEQLLKGSSASSAFGGQ